MTEQCLFQIELAGGSEGMQLVFHPPALVLLSLYLIAYKGGDILTAFFDPVGDTGSQNFLRSTSYVNPDVAGGYLKLLIIFCAYVFF